MVLTALLSVSCVLISWNSIREREAEFYVALLLLEAGLFGVFCAFDLMLFYVFFEFTLVPLFFLIAMWGGPQRRLASVKFFLYTLAGSLVTLLGVVMLASRGRAAGLETPTLAARPGGVAARRARFEPRHADHAVPDARRGLPDQGARVPVPHVAAAGARRGADRRQRAAGRRAAEARHLRLPADLPAAVARRRASSVGVPLIAILSVIGIVYGSMCALVQRDVKKLVAYSSVAHMGFCMLGLFALNAEGITGGVLQMINHGLSTGGLFLLVGMIYDRYHTRMLDDLGGLAARLPFIACLLVFISMASIGLPGLNGFVGEMLSLAGMFKRIWLYAALGATGVVLGAWYLLTMLQHLLFGPLKEPAAGTTRHGHGPAARHQSFRELLAIVPGRGGVPVDRRAAAAADRQHAAGDRGARRAVSIPTTASPTPGERSGAARPHPRHRHPDPRPGGCRTLATPRRLTSHMPELIPNIKDAALTIVPEAMLLATVCLMLLLGPVPGRRRGQGRRGRQPAVDDPVAASRWRIAGWVFVQVGRPAGSRRGPFAADGLTFFVRALTLRSGPRAGDHAHAADRRRQLGRGATPACSRCSPARTSSRCRPTSSGCSSRWSW